METITKKQKNKVLAPKLRFKGFEDSWINYTIDEIASVTSGGTPSRTNKNFWGGNVPWITTSLIDFNLILSAEEYITQEGLSNSSAKTFPVGTILMAMYGQGKTRGKVAILGIEATTNQACAAIISKEKIYNRFLYQNLAGRYDEIRDLSNEGGQQNLSGGIIKEIKISIPSLPEQQKIAGFLSAVDEKIQQLTRKKQLLEQYKKGIMQQLFSGKLRFKDENGKAYPNWEEKKLGEVAMSYYQGINTTADKTEYFTNGYPIIQAKHITSEVISFDDVRYVNKKDYEKYKSKYNPKLNDILISNIGTLGKVVLVEENYDFLIAWNIFKVEPNLNIINSNFLTFNLKYISSCGYFESKQTGNATKFVNKSDMLEIPLILPKLEEQKKIANFLSGIDVKIEGLSNQLNQSQQFKKGLLQQMFV